MVWFANLAESFNVSLPYLQVSALSLSQQYKEAYVPYVSVLRPLRIFIWLNNPPAPSYLQP